jgi:hypothetical protein
VNPFSNVLAAPHINGIWWCTRLQQGERQHEAFNTTMTQLLDMRSMNEPALKRAMTPDHSSRTSRTSPEM